MSKVTKQPEPRVIAPEQAQAQTWRSALRQGLGRGLFAGAPWGLAAAMVSLILHGGPYGYSTESGDGELRAVQGSSEPTDTVRPIGRDQGVVGEVGGVPIPPPQAGHRWVQDL